MYWFSQTIGPGRGLEDAIDAAGRARISCELHLRGSAAEGYAETLQQLARKKAPNLAVRIHPPGLPDEMTALAGPFDIGLSLEQPSSINRSLCLTNKALVYLLAGLALAATDTEGHRVIANALGGGALVVPAGDVAALSEGLQRFANEPGHLLDCRKASWNAAVERWHWEHAEERGKLLSLFEATQ
jgi:glycosyltransferase involved in cell wall biosynthesis